MIRRHNEGLVNANMYLNLTNTIVKKNTVGSAHLRYCTLDHFIYNSTVYNSREGFKKKR